MSKSKATDCRTSKYAELRFSSSFDRGSKKETAVMGMVESLINLQTDIAISTNSSLEDRGLITKDRRQGDHENFWRRKVI